MTAILLAASGGYAAGLATAAGIVLLICIAIWKDIRG
ncbi:hypothetical protein MCEMIE4_03130 [Sphingobium cupriresistens]